jgi:hypothetical protein
MRTELYDTCNVYRNMVKYRDGQVCDALCGRAPTGKLGMQLPICRCSNQCCDMVPSLLIWRQVGHGKSLRDLDHKGIESAWALVWASDRASWAPEALAVGCRSKSSRRAVVVSYNSHATTFVGHHSLPIITNMLSKFLLLSLSRRRSYLLLSSRSRRVRLVARNCYRQRK